MSKFRGWSDPRNLIPAKFNLLKVYKFGRNKIWRMENIFKFGGNIIWRTPKKRKFWRELNLADFCLPAKISPPKVYDKHAVKVAKEGEIVGRLPKLFSKYCTLILLSGGTIQTTVTGKRENKRGNGLELPCKVNAPFFICSK